jgi:hypothetical protein
VLIANEISGGPSTWRALDPLWAGASEYSTLMAIDSGTVFVIYERSATLRSKNGNEVLRLTELRLT